MDELIKEYEERLVAGCNFYMDAEQLLDVMEYYLREGRTAEAELCLGIALRLHPDNEEVIIAKAYILKDQGRWDEAEQVVRSLSNQCHRDVQFFYVEELLARAEIKQAEERFMSLLPQVMLPADYEWYEEYAEILVDYCYFIQAIKILEKVPQSAECYKHCLQLMSESYFRIKEYATSEVVQNKIIDLDPYDATAWVQLAEIQHHCGKFTESEDSCTYALTIDPHFKKAQNMKLSALVDGGDYEGAIKFAHDRLQISPTDHYANLQLGEAYKNMGDINKAMNYLQKALKYCPLDSNTERDVILYDIGACLFSLGRHDEAIEMFCANQNAVYTRANAYTFMANSYFKAGRETDALNLFRHGFEVGDLTADDYPLVAQILFQQKCFASAHDLWKSILQDNEFPAELFPILSYARQELGKEKGKSE